MAALFRRPCDRFMFICGACSIAFIVWYLQVHAMVMNKIESYEWSTFDFEGRKHDDPELIEFIRRKVIYPPEEPLPYNLVHPEEKDFSKHGQGPELRKIFGSKRNAFFIEAGGFTGEDYSPTLFWEREYNWTGILIEPHPYYYSLLAGKNRRAMILNAGISPTNTSNTLTFTNDGWGSRIINETVRKTLPPSKYFTIPCFPMTSILTALGRPEVDLFSLDIETYELPVLRTMDLLRALDIRVFMIECYKGCDPLRLHMESNGYKQWIKLEYDGIYVKKGVKTF